LASFDKVQDWVNELQTNVFDDILICIVGNQIDKKYRKVEQKLAEDFAADIGALYFETSAKANIGIERMFLTISQEICRSLPENVPNGTASESASPALSLRASLATSGGSQAESEGGCCLTS
jgi:Ras-related protein Rab-21